ncbi:MAG: four helix bundle protein [Candidatus Methylomirabilota bacterium]|jgi:four helix bundle protein
MGKGLNKPHKRLDAWSLSMEFAVQIYKATEAFPHEERFGLTSQLRRSAVSIPSNIAEGAARQTKKEFLNSLHISQGSVSEVDAELELANRLGFLPDDLHTSLVHTLERIDSLISGLIRSLRTDLKVGRKR